MMDQCYNWGWFHPIWFFLFFLVLWLIIGRSWWWGRRSGGWYRSPLDHLKERYAKGEISKEEYERMKTDLK